MKNDFVYDLESYPNIFTMAVEHAWMPFTWFFEISEWQNDSVAICEFMEALKQTNARMVGFNNIGYDYNLLHLLYKMRQATSQVLYEKTKAIISSQNFDRWGHQVRPSDRIVTQLDLFKIHHYDNPAKATSLKLLEFNMRSESVEDLPYDVGTVLNYEQSRKLIPYNKHDVSETKKFYHHTLEMIEFREQLSNKYGKDFLNHNDVKIGTTIFEMELEKAGVQLYEYGPNGRKPRQTIRKSINLSDAILPWIQFETSELQRVLDWLRGQTITETKGVFKDLIATVDGFHFVFGLGGIHGSVESQVVESDDDMVIIDIDVESYYPSTAIAQGYYPEHIGPIFTEIYAGLKEQRKQHKKGAAENAMLKLALNGTYGQSNAEHSVFKDPLMTMRITLNGQLLLCLLAEQLLKIERLKLIQANTDGLTIYLPRKYLDFMRQVVQWWEKLTNLKMEEAEYSRMFIRDVNNYIAEYVGGKLKRKGAYEYILEWHKNHSALVIPKVAEKVLLTGANIRESVENHDEVMDFMLRTKVPRNSKLVLDEQGIDIQIQNITRYLISKEGGRLFKMMPPAPKQAKEGRTEWRRIGINTGWNVTEWNTVPDNINSIEFRANINYDFYVKEVEKLVLGLK